MACLGRRAMNKTRAISLGLLSSFVILSGMIVAVVISVMQTTSKDGWGPEDRYNQGQLEEAVWDSNAPANVLWEKLERSNVPLWLFGSDFIVPGLLGVVAALFQNKWVYIICCIISMMCLIGTCFLTAFLGSMLVTFIFSIDDMQDNCYNARHVCVCKIGNDNITQGFESCNFLRDMIALSISLCITILIAWILLLVVSILSCLFACRTPRASSTRTLVMVPAEQPMLPLQHHQHYQPQKQW